MNNPIFDLPPQSFQRTEPSARWSGHFQGTEKLSIQMSSLFCSKKEEVNRGNGTSLKNRLNNKVRSTRVRTHNMDHILGAASSLKREHEEVLH